MTIKIIQPAGGSATLPTLYANPHVIAADETIADGTTVIISRYVKIAAGVTLTIGEDSDLEIT